MRNTLSECLSFCIGLVAIMGIVSIAYFVGALLPLVPPDTGPDAWLIAAQIALGGITLILLLAVSFGLASAALSLGAGVRKLVRRD